MQKEQERFKREQKRVKSGKVMKREKKDHQKEGILKTKVAAKQKER
jgi:hypothetical protein